MTHSGHTPDRNPAAQQPFAVPRCAILEVGGTAVLAAPPPRFRTIQVCPKDLRELPGHPEPAVSWHSGFRGGVHARPKMTPVHYAAERRGGLSARGARAAAAGDAGDWVYQWQVA